MQWCGFACNGQERLGRGGKGGEFTEAKRFHRYPLTVKSNILWIGLPPGGHHFRDRERTETSLGGSHAAAEEGLQLVGAGHA